MQRVLRAIPLPLRIAAVVLLFLAIYALLDKVSSSLFVVVAVFLWVVTLLVWMYDQGWLNPLARVPVLSGFLGFMSNRAAVIPVSSAGHKASVPPGQLDESERRRLFAAAEEALAGLRGNEPALEQIRKEIVDPALANPDNPFLSNAPATIVIIAGPRGIGKTTAAHAVAHLLAGAGVLEKAKVVTVKPTDVRGREFGPATQLGLVKANAARGGALVIDDAEWLLPPSTAYPGDENEGVDFGMTVVDTLRQTPGETIIIATMNEQTLGRLNEDAGHQRWLGKLARRDIVFDDLHDDALLEVLEMALAAMRWQMQDENAANAARRSLAEMRDRKGEGFDNAEACRRAAELYVKLTLNDDEHREWAEKRVVSREIVVRADDELE